MGWRSRTRSAIGPGQGAATGIAAVSGGDPALTGVIAAGAGQVLRAGLGSEDLEPRNERRARRKERRARRQG